MSSCRRDKTRSWFQAHESYFIQRRCGHLKRLSDNSGSDCNQTKLKYIAEFNSIFGLTILLDASKIGNNFHNFRIWKLHVTSSFRFNNACEFEPALEISYVAKHPTQTRASTGLLPNKSQKQVRQKNKGFQGNQLAMRPPIVNPCSEDQRASAVATLEAVCTLGHFLETS